MMNQRIVIYIILSAILLYLYYVRRDLAIFAVFIVVVGATLIFGDRSAEGFSVGGIGGGGGDKIDKECAKLGFTAPKLDKDDLSGSLDKVMKNIKTVAEKHWPYDDMNGTTNDEKKKATLSDIVGVATEEMKLMEGNGEADIQMFGKVTMGIYNGKIKAEHILSDTKMMTSAMSGSKLLLKILDKAGNSRSVMDKPTADDAKKLIVYGRCLCKHWIAIFKKIEGISKGGSSGDDEKKKKNTSKKDDDGEEEEKPKKKKKAKKEEDAEDDE